MRESATSRPLVAGRYRLEDVLGRGGMGVVWRATDELIGRPVAVKEVRPPPGLPAEDRTLFGERALREARAAGRINHPAAVTIYDVVSAAGDDEAVYIVTELVTAPTLAEVLRQEGALPANRITMLAVRLLDALEAAHTAGVVHRDVKPSNIMVLDDADVKLVDFGIAHTSGDTRLTRAGVIGSASYLAPELFQGDSPSPAADLWAAGMTLLHAVDGREPFDGASTAAVIHSVLYGDLPPVHCDPPLADVIGGLLTRDPQQRMTLPQARELLTTAVDTRPIPPPRTATSPDEDLTSSQKPSGGHGQHTSGGQDLIWEQRATRIRRGPPAESTYSVPPTPAESEGGLTLESSIHQRIEEAIFPIFGIILAAIVVLAVGQAWPLSFPIGLVVAFLLLWKAAEKSMKRIVAFNSTGISLGSEVQLDTAIPWRSVLSIGYPKTPRSDLILRVRIRSDAPAPRKGTGVKRVAPDLVDITVPWPPAPAALAEMLGRSPQKLDLRPEAGRNVICRTIDRFAPHLTPENL